jgi:hypothetical protein
MHAPSRTSEPVPGGGMAGATPPAPEGSETLPTS